MGGLIGRLEPAVGALRTALGEPAIRQLMVAWFAANAGQWALLVINLVVAYQLGGAVGVGAFGLARYLMPTLLAPFVGLPVARWPTETVLRGTNAVRTLAVLALVAVTVVQAPLWSMLLLVAVEASAGAFTRPLHMGLLPGVAQTPGQLIAANVTSGAAEGLGTFVGPALASILLVATGPVGALVAVVVIDLISVLSVARLHIPTAWRRDRPSDVRAALAEVPAGARAVMTIPGLRLVIATLSLQTFVRGLLTVLIVIASIELLGLGEAGVGTLNALIGLGGLGTGRVMQAIRREGDALAQLEHVSATMWARIGGVGKLVIKEGAAISGHTLTGAALGYVAQRLAGNSSQPSPETLEEWLLQGASIAMGRYIGKALEARLAAARKLAAIKGFAAGKKLLDATTELHARLRVKLSPQFWEAEALYEQRRKVFDLELATLRELLESPERMEAAGLHLSVVEHMAAEVEGQRDHLTYRNYAESPLHAARLEELIPGGPWTGSLEQIIEALEWARNMSELGAVKAPEGDSHTWHVALGKFTYELIERVDPHAESARSTTHAARLAERKAKFTRWNHGAPYAGPSAPHLPHRYLRDVELRPMRETPFRKRWQRALSDMRRQPVAIGRPIKTATEGHALLMYLAAGKQGTLERLGVLEVPENLDTSTREWALVQGRDGFAIYLGNHSTIALYLDVRLLAHTHPAPLPEGSVGGLHGLPAELNGKTYAEIVANLNTLGETGITPSPRDIHAISDGNDHVIYLPYVHVGGGRVANLSGNRSDRTPRLQLHLSNTKVKLMDVRRGRYWYETNIVVRDVTGLTLWEGKVYTEWHANTADGRLQFTRPTAFDHPQHDGMESVPPETAAPPIAR